MQQKCPEIEFIAVSRINHLYTTDSILVKANMHPGPGWKFIFQDLQRAHFLSRIMLFQVALGIKIGVG
jgi:hypothetical protein